MQVHLSSLHVRGERSDRDGSLDQAGQHKSFGAEIDVRLHGGWVGGWVGWVAVVETTSRKSSRRRRANLGFRVGISFRQIPSVNYACSPHPPPPTPPPQSEL